MVYEAPLHAVAVGSSELFRQFFLCIEDHLPRKVLGFRCKFPLWLHWYTWYFAFCFCLMLWQTHDMYIDVMSVSSWLDPLVTEQYANTSLIRESGMTNTSLDHQYQEWKDEASLEDWQLLRFFSMMSPVWLCCNFWVSAHHAYLHVKRIGTRTLRSCPMRDSTIRILGLPLCYGLVSFKSVVRMWQLVIDHVGTIESSHFTSYEARRDFVCEMYESNFMVGDIYESWSLAVFGALLMDYIKMQMGPGGGPAQLTRTNSGTAGEAEKNYLMIQQNLGFLTVAGIRLFFWTCLIQSTYTIFVTGMGFYFTGDSAFYTNETLEGFFSPDPAKESTFQSEYVKETSKTFFLGAGFVSSWAAIQNIMQVEHGFKHLLDEFHPQAKFWGTKILVTLAFVQSMVLVVIPPFNGWSVVRRNLLYASFLNLECFVMSLSLMKAWDADQDWYLECELAAAAAEQQALAHEAYKLAVQLEAARLAEAAAKLHEFKEELTNSASTGKDLQEAAHGADELMASVFGNIDADFVYRRRQHLEMANDMEQLAHRLNGAAENKLVLDRLEAEKAAKDELKDDYSILDDDLDSTADAKGMWVELEDANSLEDAHRQLPEAQDASSADATGCEGEETNALRLRKPATSECHATL